VNGLEFGDSGELYIQVGGYVHSLFFCILSVYNILTLSLSCSSNTNGGLPGRSSGSQKQKENVLSSATLVAYLSNPDFDGTITYDSDDDGNQVGGLGSVEVFASGMRNPFGIVLHSNGRLYGTDNGPNERYGKMAMGCNGQRVDDIEEEDKLNLIEQGKFYGHPNLKRGECVWRSSYEPSGNGYTAPLLELRSSSDGIVEFQSDHFE